MPTFLHRMSGPGSAGDVWVCTMHSSGAGNLATVHAAWQTFVTSIYTTPLKAMWSTATQINSLSTVQLDPVTGKQSSVTQSSVALIGTGTGQTLSPRDCIVLSKRTATPTKAGRGRMYLPGPDATHLSATGLLASGDASALANSIGVALTTFKATSQPVVYHHATRTIDNITEVRVGQVLGSQTRRTNRVTNSYAVHAV